jgi:hypothetical protein
MKVLYGTAWFILAAGVVLAIVSGSFNAGALVGFSLIGLGLIYTLALWSVLTEQPREARQ